MHSSQQQQQQQQQQQRRFRSTATTTTLSESRWGPSDARVDSDRLPPAFRGCTSPSQVRRKKLTSESLRDRSLPAMLMLDDNDDNDAGQPDSLKPPPIFSSEDSGSSSPWELLESKSSSLDESQPCCPSTPCSNDEAVVVGAGPAGSTTTNSINGSRKGSSKASSSSSATTIANSTPPNLSLLALTEVASRDVQQQQQQQQQKQHYIATSSSSPPPKPLSALVWSLEQPALESQRNEISTVPLSSPRRPRRSLRKSNQQQQQYSPRFSSPPCYTSSDESLTLSLLGLVTSNSADCSNRHSSISSLSNPNDSGNAADWGTTASNRSRSHHRRTLRNNHLSQHWDDSLNEVVGEDEAEPESQTPASQPNTSNPWPSSESRWTATANAAGSPAVSENRKSVRNPLNRTSKAVRGASSGNSTAENSVESNSLLETHTAARTRRRTRRKRSPTNSNERRPSGENDDSSSDSESEELYTSGHGSRQKGRFPMKHGGDDSTVKTEKRLSDDTPLTERDLVPFSYGEYSEEEASLEDKGNYATKKTVLERCNSMSSVSITLLGDESHGIPSELDDSIRLDGSAPFFESSGCRRPSGTYLDDSFTFPPGEAAEMMRSSCLDCSTSEYRWKASVASERSGSSSSSVVGKPPPLPPTPVARTVTPTSMQRRKQHFAKRMQEKGQVTLPIRKTSSASIDDNQQ